MRLTSYRTEAGPRAAVMAPHGAVPIEAINERAGTDWPMSVEELIGQARFVAFHAWLAAEPNRLDGIAATPGDLVPAPLLLRPPKILGVGLNYQEHAGDLGEKRPDEPATFMKPATSIIAAGDTIPIPRQSERTTGEAELGLIIGKHCRDVPEGDAESVVAGFTTIIDMTAEDILQRNPRFLTRAKSFDGFLVLGPDLVTTDEVPDLPALEVSTLHGGQDARTNVVANMMFSPWYLVSFFSQVMPLEPGDVISTGTPGAVVLRHGDSVGCRIPGVGRIECPVIDRKVVG
ncbi:MAG: fumarylacetoacetate hydrolase family protein [Trueperaceae bacterium]